MSEIKKAVIALNGEPTDGYEFPKGVFIIACDAAYSFLKERFITPDLVLGDFDSLGFIPEGALVFPEKKDKTDGELAVEVCKEKGFTEVDVICFGGKREDHFLGNLSLLIKADELGIKATAFTRNSTIRYLGVGEHFFRLEKGLTVSLFSFGNCLVEKSDGLGYPYDNTTLSSASTLGISNYVTDPIVSVKIISGGAFFIVDERS